MKTITAMTHDDLLEMDTDELEVLRDDIGNILRSKEVSIDNVTIKQRAYEQQLAKLTLEFHELRSDYKEIENVMRSKARD